MRKVLETEECKYFWMGGIIVWSEIVCSQSNRQKIVSDEKRRRVCDWSHQYHCRGAIQVSYRARNVLIRIKHDEHYVAVFWYTMSGFEGEQVGDLTKAGISPWKIIRTLRREGYSSVKYNEKYNTIQCLAWSFIVRLQEKFRPSTVRQNVCF